MRIRLPVLAALGAFVILLAISGVVVYRLTRPPPPDLSLDRIHRAGEIVVGLDPSYPPFEVVDGKGQLAGMDVDLSREIARRLGVRARFVAIDFGSIFDALQVGKMDVILGGVSPDPDYQKTLRYTIPYFDDGLVLVVNPRASNEAIGIESGSDADLDQDQLRATLKGYQFRQFDDQDQIRASLAKGDLRGTIVDAATGDVWAGQMPGLIVQPKRLTSVPFVIATRAGDGRLREALNAVITSMEHDGYLAGLEQKWLR